MNQEIKQIKNLKILLFTWAFFVVIFIFDFQGFINVLNMETPAQAFFFLFLNIIFLIILLLVYSFTKKKLSLIIQEKEASDWHYQQFTALAHLINMTGRAMSAVLNRDKLMRLLLESFIKLFHCPAGLLFIYNENENTFEFEGGYGINRTSLSSHIINGTHPVFSDIVNNYKIISHLNLKSLREKNISFLKSGKLEKIVPGLDTLIPITLRIGDKIFGVVFLYTDKNSSLIIQQYETLVRVAINQATIAIGSAIQSQFAIQDRLTMLYNHNYFLQRLKEELFRCKRYRLKLCILMIDIDHFKSFNDTYGHLAGNYVLREVAKLYAKSTRITDIVARYGGEEFSILMPETSMEDAVKIAEKIRQAIEEHAFEYESQKLHVSISIGLAEGDSSTEEQKDDIDIVNIADKKLYEAKKEGRNRVCY